MDFKCYFISVFFLAKNTLFWYGIASLLFGHEFLGDRHVFENQVANSILCRNSCLVCRFLVRDDHFAVVPSPFCSLEFSLFLIASHTRDSFSNFKSDVTSWIMLLWFLLLHKVTVKRQIRMSFFLRCKKRELQLYVGQL